MQLSFKESLHRPACPRFRVGLLNNNLTRDDISAGFVLLRNRNSAIRLLLLTGVFTHNLTMSEMAMLRQSSRPGKWRRFIAVNRTRSSAALVTIFFTAPLTQHNHGQAAAGEEKVLRNVYHPLTDEEGDCRENQGKKTRSSG